MTTRFAPSPTGRLHLGHAMAAWVAHAFARRHGGKFLLRHEDIDATRVREEFYEGIEEDLRWLGFAWDEPPLRQSTRIAAYESALRKLHQLGVTYPCFCTRREIQEGQEKGHRRPASVLPSTSHLSAPHEMEPTYPGTCLHLSSETRARKLAANLPHSWRLDSRTTRSLADPLTFTDLLHGVIQVNPDLLSDVVLARKDIGIAYHLAVVIDDAFQEITHVTRGEDLLPSTHVHRLLQQLLHLSEPIYLHHPLILDESGKRLAKRHDVLSLAALRESGTTRREIMERWLQPASCSIEAVLPADASAPIRAITASTTSSKV